MTGKNKQYWRGRFEQLEKASHQNAQSTYSQIEDTFFQVQREIENKINNWYVRFANNNKITMPEAKRLLNSNELKEFKWDVQEYIKYGRENKLNGNWIKELENASARFHISRLEALKIQTQQSLERLFGNELDEVEKMASDSYTNNYYHTMFEMQKGFNVGFRIGTIDENKLSKIVNKPWAVDGKNFSERIWGKKTTLINELHKQLTSMCIQGKAPDNVIKYMVKKFNVTKAQAGNLVMTENAYFSELARKDCFKDLDVEQYEIVATLDLHTSNICQEQDGKTYNMKNYETGVTAPPFHNYCRSITAPYFDDNYDIKDTRIARGENGKTHYVPNDIKYKNWKEKYVTNSDNSSIMNKNENKEEKELKYEDVTKQMYRNAKPKEGKVEKQNFFESDGEKYFVDGHNVIYKHDDREIEVAKLLNEMFGGDVQILPNINYPQGIKTSDYIFRGEKLDLKRITSKRTKDCVKTAIRNSERQAHNFIIDNTLQTVSDDVVLSQIDEIYNTVKFSWVDTIYVLKENKFIKVYKRK